MKVKMTVSELAEKNHLLQEVVKREKEHIDHLGELKFTPKVSIAIAKNLKAITDEIKPIMVEQDKNKAIADKKGIELTELPEQKALMNAEVEVYLKMVTENDIEQCKISSIDVLALLFMTDNEKEETNNAKN